jgi:hypothetical protein
LAPQLQPGSDGDRSGRKPSTELHHLAGVAVQPRGTDGILTKVSPQLPFGGIDHGM